MQVPVEDSDSEAEEMGVVWVFRVIAGGSWFHFFEAIA
jgi:hypothetical protein